MHCSRDLSLLMALCGFILVSNGQSRARDHGIKIGVLAPGPHNAITDVRGVLVGHHTLNEGDNIRTGLTVIKPHGDNIFDEKVTAAIFVGNGFGKLAGSTQIKELGNIETPIVLTNTLNVGTMMEALVGYTLSLPGNENVRSVNAVVGETNDGWLNDIRTPALQAGHLLQALEQATGGRVPEGNVGAGTGTVCFGYKGGIGTSSRVLPGSLGGYTIGVLVQTNFGGSLRIDGVPVGEVLGKYYLSDQLQDTADGSCMIVVATDAPLDSRNLQRLGLRALFGLARTGGIGSNGSGDYVISFTVHPDMLIGGKSNQNLQNKTLSNDSMSPLFMAVIEATEEAIINSLLAAESMQGFQGREIKALPIEQILPILKEHGAISD